MLGYGTAVLTISFECLNMILRTVSNLSALRQLNYLKSQFVGVLGFTSKKRFPIIWTGIVAAQWTKYVKAQSVIRTNIVSAQSVLA